MTKLEQAVKDLDEKFKHKYSVKNTSIHDRALQLAANMSFIITNEIKSEESRHLITKNQLGRQLSNLHNTLQILNGSRGYLRCSQGWNSLRPCFDTFHDIVKDLRQSMVDVYLEEPSCPFGMEVWEIDERGMMNLINCVRDTSD